MQQLLMKINDLEATKKVLETQNDQLQFQVNREAMRGASGTVGTLRRQSTKKKKELNKDEKIKISRLSPFEEIKQGFIKG